MVKEFVIVLIGMGFRVMTTASATMYILERGVMMYRIPPYVREVKRRLGTFLTQDWVSRLIVVIGITGVLVIGLLTVEALLRFFILVIALVAIGVGGRFWWLHRAMPPAASRKDAEGRTIESEYVVIDRQVTSRKRKLRRDRSRVK